jgi:hypothetical protein
MKTVRERVEEIKRERERERSVQSYENSNYVSERNSKEGERKRERIKEGEFCVFS